MLDTISMQKQNFNVHTSETCKLINASPLFNHLNFSDISTLGAFPGHLRQQHHHTCTIQMTNVDL